MTCKGPQCKVEMFTDILEERNLNRLCNTQFSKIIYLFFWSQACSDSVELKDILKEYFQGSSVPCTFGCIDVNLPATKELCQRFGITKTPSLISIDSTKKVLKRFDDLDPVGLYESLETEANAFSEAYKVKSFEMFEKIEQLLKDKPVMLFIKGTPENPECGFTEQILQALESQGVEYSSYNVMAQGGEDMRNWIKEYSKWPTIPQLFINGKIVGGVDKLKELIANNEFLSMVPKEALKSSNLGADKFTEITSKDIVVLFVNSDFENFEEQAENCNYCKISLQLKGLRFKVVDVHGDRKLESYVKTFVNSPKFKFPVLVHNKSLVSFGDELMEKIESSDFKDVFDASLFRTDIMEQIKTLINSSPVMIFIKGSPEEPKCGFTSQLLTILDDLKVKYSHFDILQDQLVREKLKEYSDWKTYPQVYVKGELVGGLDVIKEMIEEGEFQKLTSGI